MTFFFFCKKPNGPALYNFIINTLCDFVDKIHRLLIKCWRGGTAALLGVISGRTGVREVKQERISFRPKVSRELIILHVNVRFVPSGRGSFSSLSERNGGFIVGRPSA